MIWREILWLMVQECGALLPVRAVQSHPKAPHSGREGHRFTVLPRDFFAKRASHRRVGRCTMFLHDFLHATPIHDL